MFDLHIHTEHSEGMHSGEHVASVLPAKTDTWAVTDKNSIQYYLEGGSAPITGVELDCWFYPEQTTQARFPISLLAYGFELDKAARLLANQSDDALPIIMGWKAIGAKVFLAHPYRYAYPFSVLHELHTRLDGVECAHPSAKTRMDVARLADFCKENDLAITAGSGWHHSAYVLPQHLDLLNESYAPQLRWILELTASNNIPL